MYFSFLCHCFADGPSCNVQKKSIISSTKIHCHCGQELSQNWTATNEKFQPPHTQSSLLWPLKKTQQILQFVPSKSAIIKLWFLHPFDVHFQFISVDTISPSKCPIGSIICWQLHSAIANGHDNHLVHRHQLCIIGHFFLKKKQFHFSLKKNFIPTFVLLDDHLQQSGN